MPLGARVSARPLGLALAATLATQLVLAAPARADGPPATTAPIAAAAAPESVSLHLDVPIVRQAPAHCGPAALTMVMRFYGADSSAARVADRAFDPALQGALITDLAAAARSAGYAAEIVRYSDSLLVAELARGRPPIVLYQHGSGVVTTPHYAVVVGWDAASGAYTLHDGGPKPRRIRRSDLAARARGAGNRALLVGRRP
jgi:ABC-type bacteriocin/lantibiotic exporter with double-glycine peptidase domain